LMGILVVVGVIVLALLVLAGSGLGEVASH
jgi:hypothetical protein